MSSKKKPTSKAKTSEKAQAQLTWQPNKTFSLKLIIPKKEVAKAYDQVLEEAVKNTTVKGFRKGKAPKKIVEEQVDKERLSEQMTQRLITTHYLQAIKQHQLRPIIAPKISVISMKQNEDWVITATACEAPEVKLGEWEKILKDARTASKIWTPDSKQTSSEVSFAELRQAAQKTGEKPESKQDKLSKIFDILLKEAVVGLAKALIDDERDRLLSNLLHQVNKLGMTVEQYLNSQHLSADQVRKQYQQLAERTLKLEFILAKIAEQKQIKVSAQEVDQAIQATPNKTEKEKLQTSDQKAYIASTLQKQKTIDYLLSL